jgi:hypothetical protein
MVACTWILQGASRLYETSSAHGCRDYQHYQRWQWHGQNTGDFHLHNSFGDAVLNPTDADDTSPPLAPGHWF